MHLGKTRWELPNVEPIGYTWDQHKADLAARREFRDLLIRIKNKTGEIFVSTSGQPVFNDDGEFLGYRGIAKDVTQTIQAERTLLDVREAADKGLLALGRLSELKELIEALPVGITLVNKERNFVTSNSASARLQEVPRELLAPGRPVRDLYLYKARRGDMGPGNPDEIVAARMQLTESNSQLAFERIRQDGGAILVTTQPFADGGVLTVYSDISDRKRREALIIDAERKDSERAKFLQALIDGLPVGVALVDQDMKILVANQANSLLQGIPAGMQVAGKSLIDVLRYHAQHGFYGPGDPEAHVARVVQRAKEPTPVQVERTLANGSVIDIRARNLPDGSRLTTVIDITERKRLEERFRAVVELTPTAIVMIARNGTLVLANKQTEKLFGKPREQLIGSPITSLMPERLRPGFPAMLEEYFEHPTTRILSKADVLCGIRPDGEEFPVELGLNPVRTMEGDFILSAIVDLTERRRAELEMRNARDAAEAGSKAKSDFLAVMSHEIRTPMNAVIGLLELLRLSRLDPEQRDTVDAVRESSKSLLRLIDDVLDYSKIESGKLELTEEPYSLARLCHIAHQNFGPTASQKGVLILKEIDPNIAPSLIFDQVRVRQIINNLLSNAIKFTEHGTITLSATRVDADEETELVRIAISDTGVGISPDAIERVFVPFSQADASIERTYGGTGLGLSICQRLANRMGGAIEVQSTQGVGTTVSMTVRFRRASGERAADDDVETIDTMAQSVQGFNAPPIDAARALSTLILVVDDHPVNRQLMARQLNVLGMAAETAADGNEAMRLLAKGGYGMVITDCQMPGMDGFELAQAIRRGTGNIPKSIPIVACTANISKEALDRCINVGMNEAVVKPVELAKLKQILNRWNVATPPDGPTLSPVHSTSEFAGLDELTEGDMDLKQSLLAEFLAANTADVKAAAAAVRGVAADDLRRSAHRIKGAAKTFGLATLAEAAARVESAAQAGDWHLVASTWPFMREECMRVNESVARQLQV